MKDIINGIKEENLETGKTWYFNFMRSHNINEKTLYNMLLNFKDIVILFEVDENWIPIFILDVNNTACDKLGYSREELQESSLEGLGIYLDSPGLNNVKKEFLEKQFVFTKTNLLNKSGLNVPVEINASLLNIRGRKVVLLIGKDISNRELIEKRLVDNNNELKSALEDLKMIQQQLIQQEKLAAIGQLAAGVAHEINNPLGYIYSNIETSRLYFERYKNMMLLYEGLIDSLFDISPEEIQSKISEIKSLEIKCGKDFISTDMEELYDDVEEGLKKISEIVTSLKTFSRVDEPGELEKYDLNNGIKTTLMMARNEIKYHARVIEILNDIPMIRVLGNQIDQVLLNIILNAVKGVKAREVDDLGLIIVRTCVADGYILCEIEDNGIGIDEENIEKIFDPFFTTKLTGQGTGLGLSIAYDIIVNKYGGEILVKSLPNVKTKFTIKLPIKHREGI